MTTPKRIEWVDNGKFICIMFVMLSHLESATRFLGTFFSPFFLTLFFFLSGYVFRQPATFKEHFIKKIKGLFVPWLIFSHFNILLSAVVTLKGERDPLCEMGWNALQVRGHGDGIWFVAALFVAFIPFYFVIKWNKPVQACILSSVLSLISVLYSHLMDPEVFPWGSTALPWHLEYIFQAMLWMVLGYYFRMYSEAFFDKLNTIANRALLWVMYLIAAYVPVETWGGVLDNIVLVPQKYHRNTCGDINMQDNEEQQIYSFRWC